MHMKSDDRTHMFHQTGKCMEVLPVVRVVASARLIFLWVRWWKKVIQPTKAQVLGLDRWSNGFIQDSRRCKDLLLVPPQVQAPSSFWRLPSASLRPTGRQRPPDETTFGWPRGILFLWPLDCSHFVGIMKGINKNIQNTLTKSAL